MDAPYAVVGEGSRIAVPAGAGPQRSRWSSKGMPHGRATEKRFLIAVQGEKVWGALEYRVAERSLFLGSLPTEPWAQERLLPARALYNEARVLAREAGLWEVRADANSWDDYPYEVR